MENSHGEPLFFNYEWDILDGRPNVESCTHMATPGKIGRFAPRYRWRYNPRKSTAYEAGEGDDLERDARATGL